ncbi:MAG: GMC family oxidoreductase [Gammaproteobacteria bacterium]|jgi:choline dehydrogenase-like flavoprotein|nr:GMC family oxidoreductase [Gammaproteobacteria bacterium]
MKRRTFLAGLGAGLAGLAGATAWWSRRERPAVVHLSHPAGDLAPLERSDPWDVAIIGSGPAGTVLATDLARKGLATVLLESGQSLSEMGDPRYAELERYESRGALDYPLAATRVRALGGTSNVWTGRCSRLHPVDFEPNALTLANAPWPIRYSDLQPWYALAEKTLRVRGGELSSYHPPRSGPLPLPPEMDISGLKQLLAGIGVTADYSPSSTAPEGGGPVRAARDLLPAYLQAGGTLVPGVTVTGLEADAGKQRIVSARVANLDRREIPLRARTFVIAAGGVESARLLQLSGLDAGPVGVAFMEHPNLNFSGRVEHSWDTLSPTYELARCHQFYDAFKARGLGSVLLVFTQSWVFRNDLKGWDLEALKEKAGALASRLGRAELRIGVTTEMAPQLSNRIVLSESQKDFFGNPGAALRLAFAERDLATQQAARELVRDLYSRLAANEVEERPLSWSHHHLGSCRMGADPRTSVVDADLRVHGLENLYVAGSAVFATGGAAHPTLAITALSHRLAAHLNA